MATKNFLEIHSSASPWHQKFYTYYFVGCAYDSDSKRYFYDSSRAITNFPKQTLALISFDINNKIIKVHPFSGKERDYI